MKQRTFLSMLLVVIPLLLSCRSDGAQDGDPTATAAPASSSVTVTSTTHPAPATTTPASVATATSETEATATTEAASPTAPPATATIEATATAVAVELAPVDAQLVERLRGGGYVVYVRVDAGNEVGADIDACMAQRAVGDEVLANARAIGVAFQQLEIPVGRVVSGESCAEVVSATVAFGDVEVFGADGEIPLDNAEAGENLIVVAAEIDVEGLEAGNAAILERGGGSWTTIAIVRADEWLALATQVTGPRFQQYPVPPGSRPHDVAPAADGGVWYTAQGSGELGWLDPVTGETRHIALGVGSAPHGVIVGPDGAPWITDSGQNAIVRVDPHTHEVQVFPLGGPIANLNTAAFDGDGVLWFTGQAGYYGRLDPATGEAQVWDAPRGRGPYGIDATPDGEIYYASLAGSHIANVDIQTGEATVLDPSTAGQGARRVWSDSRGRIWVSEWNAGQVGVYDPASGEWREWRMPGDNPMPYAVYVDERDIVWLSDFGANTLVSFDPESELFESFPLPANPSNVRQILGRPYEVWGAESAADTLVVLRVP